MNNIFHTFIDITVSVNIPSCGDLDKRFEVRWTKGDVVWCMMEQGDVGWGMMEQGDVGWGTMEQGEVAWST